MQSRKAVFLDIDGTLIAGAPVPFGDDLAAMEEAAQKGHLLFLNTGRSFANIPPPLLELACIRGIAAGGGAHILLAASPPRGRSGFRTIYHKWFSGDQLAKVFAWYGTHSRCCILEGERDCYIINHSLTWTFEDKVPVPVSSLDDFKRKSRGDYITKLTLDGIASEEEHTLLEPFSRINSFSNYSELIIKGENKARAMELVLNKFGIERKDSIAIGDSANDLDMIRFAGLGIAMGNACAELKAASGAVTGYCGKGGVAEALRKFAP